MISIFLSTYGAVFVAEIVGDKLLYTTGVLATRYHARSIFYGMALAFMLKTAVAVAIGDLIAHLPRAWVTAMTAASFLAVTVALWRKPDLPDAKERAGRLPTGAAVAFAAVFFSEWVDVGMVMTATMAARFVWSARTLQEGAPGYVAAATAVWVSATAAMVTKGTLAVTLGAGARRWVADRVDPRFVRFLAVSAVIVLGALSVLETVGVLTE